MGLIKSLSLAFWIKFVNGFEWISGFSGWEFKQDYFQG